MIPIFGTALAVFIGTLPLLAGGLAVTGKLQDFFRWLKRVLEAKAVTRVYINRVDMNSVELDIDPAELRRHPRKSGLRAFNVDSIYLRKRLTSSSYVENLAVSLRNDTDSKFPEGQIVFKTPKGWQHPDLDMTRRQPDELIPVDPRATVQLVISDRDFFDFLKQHGVTGRFKVRVGFRYRKELSDDYKVITARRRLKRLGNLHVNVKKKHLTSKEDLLPEVEYRKAGTEDETFKKVDHTTFKSVGGPRFPYYAMLQDFVGLLGFREGYRVLRANLVWLSISYEEGKMFDLSEEGRSNIMNYYHYVYTTQEQRHAPVFVHDQYASSTDVYETDPREVFTIGTQYGGSTTDEHRKVFDLMKPYYEQANKLASEKQA